jgi:hypothetical protein
MSRLCVRKLFLDFAFKEPQNCEWFSIWQGEMAWFFVFLNIKILNTAGTGEKIRHPTMAAGPVS